MTKARDLANIISGGFTEADIPNLSASKITSGTFADARIAASNVSQHATSFDDNKIVNDISTLGLRVHTQENLNASNTNSASFDVFQDSSGVTNLTNVARNDAEYISSVSASSTSAITVNHSNYTNYVSSVNTRFNSSGSLDTSWASGDEMPVQDTNGADTSGTYSVSALGLLMFNEDAASNVNSNIWQDGGSTFNHYYGGGNGGDATWFFQFNAGSYTGFTPNGGINLKMRNGGGSISHTYAYGIPSSGGTAALLSTIHTGSPSHGSSISSTISNSTSYPTIAISLRMTGNNWMGFDDLEINGTAQQLTTSATGSFEGATITAGASTSKMGAVITYQDNAGTNTLNTDIILKLSADNGSNYSTATLTALPDFATGIKMAKVNDLSVTAGTQLKYKIEFANQSAGSKEARIRGVSLQY
jgi:hypothetical protein